MKKQLKNDLSRSFLMALQRGIKKATIPLVLFACISVAAADVKVNTTHSVADVLSIQNSITGLIVDADGVPLPGASVVVKGTTNGTQTDFDGNFTIAASNNDVLLISYIGFVAQEIPVNGKSVVNVTLEADLSQLDEVVVVGYGTQKKEAITGAVSSVSSEDIAALPVVSFTEALQGRVAGIQVTNSGGPGTDPIVQIRGIGSINFASSPLYVVDGYPVGGLSDFDNNDIENISVLKDASASAIYGSRAANGVVLVTTKRGRPSADGKVEFTYKGFSGFAQAGNRLDLLNRDQYLEFGRELLGNAGATFPSRWDNLNEPIYEGTNQTYAQTDVDYQDEVFRTGVTASHSLSMRGGTDKSRFFSSFGYFNQDGIIVGTGFSRYNFRVNSDHDINDWLTIGQSLALSNGKRQNEASLGGRTQVQNIIRGIPYIPLRDPTLQGGLRAPDGSDGTDPENPLRATLDTNRDSNVRIFGTAYADVKLADGLSYRFTAGIDWNNLRNVQLQPIYFDGFKGRNENITIDEQTTSSGNYFSNQLNFAKGYGKHNFDAIAVAERQDFNQYSIRGQGQRTSNDLNVLTGTEAQTVQGTDTSNVIYSFLGRLNYDYDGRYLFSASLRRDGSSKFAEGFKWRTFPGVSAGWNIAQEPFAENWDNLSELKIRGSWGQIGFEGIGNFESQAGISTNTNAIINNGEAQGAFFNRLANPELEWEITEMTNIGVDVGLYQNRVQFSAEWYARSTDNLILNVPIPASLGFSGSTIANVGGMDNWGLDFSAVYYSNPDREFKWNVNGVIGLYRNEITALSTETGNIFSGSNADAGGTDITRTAVGDAFQSFFGWQVDGIFQSQAQIDQFNALDGDASTPYQPNAAPGDLIFRDNSGNGAIGADDRTVIGSFIPDFNYGLNFDSSYKNFFLNMYWYGNQGNDVYNATKVFTEGGLRLFNHGINALDAWTPTNTNTSIPRMVNGDPNQNTRTSDRFVEDASFLRLQNLKIGYMFPQDWLERNLGNSLSRLSMYVSGNNLVTFTQYEGYDPEIGARNNALGTQGIDFGQYPRPLTLLVGLEIGF